MRHLLRRFATWRCRTLGWHSWKYVRPALPIGVTEQCPHCLRARTVLWCGEIVYHRPPEL